MPIASIIRPWWCRNIPEGDHLHTRCHENLKSYSAGYGSSTPTNIKSFQQVSLQFSYNKSYKCDVVRENNEHGHITCVHFWHRVQRTYNQDRDFQFCTDPWTWLSLPPICWRTTVRVTARSMWVTTDALRKYSQTSGRSYKYDWFAINTTVRDTFSYSDTETTPYFFE